MDPTIGVHIITKDEQDLLPFCLDSVRGADEIIIVDTGSTDNTTQIAAEYGARLLAVPWQEDFSLPRNYAIEHAGTDWILVLDADERLVSSLEQLRTAIRNEQAEAFSVGIDNVIGDNANDIVHHRTIRLFRRKDVYRFRGIIHEDIAPSIIDHSGTPSIIESDLQISHLGYHPSLLHGKQKAKRNEALLHKVLREEPNHPFYQYQLGVTYCQQEKLHEAVAMMEQALLTAPRGAAYRPTCVKDLCKIYLALQQPDKAEALLQKELAHYPDYRELHHLLGQALQAQGWLDRAFQAYHQALSIDPPNPLYVAESGIGTYRTLQQMAELEQRAGSVEQAARLYHKALAHHPTDILSLQGIADAFVQLDVRHQEIAELLLQIVRPQSAADYAPVFQALLFIGAYESIVKLFKDLVQPSPEVVMQHVSALMHTDRHQQADEQLAGLQQAQRVHSDDLILIIICRALCQWRLRRSLLPADTDASSSPVLSELSRLEQSIEATPPSLPASPSMEWENSETVSRLMESAAAYRLDDLADKLAALTPKLQRMQAKECYRQGRTMLAAEYFIRLYEHKAMDEECCFMLGEILYDKGYYFQAASFFEQLVADEAHSWKAKVGFALCYLRLAADSLQEALQRFPELHTLGDDARGLEANIRRLSHTPWRSRWNERQRRLKDDRQAQADIPLHDR